MDEVEQRAVTSPEDRWGLSAMLTQLPPASLCLSDLPRFRPLPNAQAVKPYCAVLTSGTNPFVIHHQTLNK